MKIIFSISFITAFFLFGKDCFSQIRNNNSLNNTNQIISPATPVVKMNYSLMGSLHKRGSSYIDLYIKKTKNPCDPTGGSLTRFKLEMQDMANYSNLGNYIVWKMDYVNCNGDLITGTYSISLDDYHEDGFNESKDWGFGSRDFPDKIYDIHFSRNDESARDVNRGRSVSIQPDSIESRSYAITGEEIRFKVSGGTLSNGSQWYWFEGGCGKGRPIDSGAAIKVKILKTTTFYVCSVLGGVPNTGCASKKIIVNDSSYSAVRINGNKQVCKGQSAKRKLKVVGGHLGLDAKWVWYKDKCGIPSNQIPAPGNGEEVEINPQRPTTYFVRAEGQVNNTDCVEFFVDLIEPSKAPQKITADPNPVCQFKELRLTIEGGVLTGDSKWEWSSKEDGSTARNIISDNSESIVQYPDKSTTYFVKAKGYCGSSDEISIWVKVNEVSREPNYISRAFVKKNKFRKFKLSAIGGNLVGENAKFQWEDQDGKVLRKNDDPEYIYKTKKPQNIRVYAIDDCGKSDKFASVQLNPQKGRGPKMPDSHPWVDDGFINGGLLLNPADSFRNLLITAGFKVSRRSQIYLRLKFWWDWSENKVKGVDKPAYTCTNNQLLNFSGDYSFNGRSFAKRTSYTAGFIGSFSKTVKFYLGGGYGRRDLLWGVDIVSPFYSEGQFAKNIDASYQGIEGEAGFMLKFGGFNIMGGMNAIYSSQLKKSFNDWDFGIGFGL